ncbi:hypothetical protein niasHT_007023 [Heterodera trifolii]|uniref:Uncharacterized protein n=1 Tax=Heterodera trifolii TaxID=157864 RepID=A0ABD2LXB8_9BILA
MKELGGTNKGRSLHYSLFSLMILSSFHLRAHSFGRVKDQKELEEGGGRGGAGGGLIIEWENGGEWTGSCVTKENQSGRKAHPSKNNPAIGDDHDVTTFADFGTLDGWRWQIRQLSPEGMGRTLDPSTKCAAIFNLVVPQWTMKLNEWVNVLLGREAKAITAEGEKRAGADLKLFVDGMPNFDGVRGEEMRGKGRRICISFIQSATDRCPRSLFTSDEEKEAQMEGQKGGGGDRRKKKREEADHLGMSIRGGIRMISFARFYFLLLAFRTPSADN